MAVSGKKKIFQSPDGGGGSHNIAHNIIKKMFFISFQQPYGS